jgi:predicted molibdopterin-dependent oxidoreductase YjgC
VTAEVDAHAALRLTVDGAPVSAAPGQSLASALAAVEPRWAAAAPTDGRFCGIGACTACLVTVNGVVGTRACLTTVEDGMDIISERRHE